MDPRPLPPTVATAPARSPHVHRPVRTSSGRGCGVALLLLVVLAAAAGGTVYWVGRADRAPAAERAAADRYVQTIGTYELSLYDAPDLFQYVPRSPGGRPPSLGGADPALPDAAALQAAGWEVEVDGWNERVAILRPPGGVASASEALQASAGLLGLDILNVDGANMEKIVATGGRPDGYLFEEEPVDASFGRNLPGGSGQDFRTTLLLTSTPDDRGVLVIQLTWREDGRRPPEGELDAIWGSVKPI